MVFNFSGQSEEEVRERIRDYFPSGATVYAVLDYAAGFGVYQDGVLLFWEREAEAPEELDWTYLRELRVFDRKKELFAVPVKDGAWSGRIRVDEEEMISSQRGGKQGEFILEEYQKLWGERAQSRWAQEKDWTLLASGRGTRLWIPIFMEWEGRHTATVAALLVRRYLRKPDLFQAPELVYQNDIRMVEIVPCVDIG